MAFLIPNLERIVSNVLEGGTGITALRNVEWEKKFLWAVDFVEPKPPAPFEDFFPANDVTIPMAIIESHQIDLPQGVFSFPVRTNQKEINITFYDDESRTLLKWITDWMNLDILNNGQFISGLRDSHNTVSPDSFGETRPVAPVRQLRLALLEAGRDEVAAYDFWVYPEGEIAYNGAQVSDAQTYTVTFKIVQDTVGGDLKKKKLFSIQTLRETLGRFF